MLRLERILSYFLIPAFFFLFHMFLDLAFNVYDRFPWFASVMHFAGGTMLAITFFLLMNYLNKEKYFKSDKFMRFVFVISLVSLISIFWEFYEYFMVTVFKSQIVSLVTHLDSSQPGTGGTKGEDPVEITIFFPVIVSSPFVSSWGLLK